MTLQNQGAITAFLAGKGLTSAQIAGVEGNLETESSGVPTASNPREGAVGIAQWEGGRRTGLDNFAKATGGSETDLGTQLNFMWSELTGPESGALSALLATNTPAAAATVFDQRYERSSAASLPTRVAKAQAIFAGGVQGGSGQVTTGGDAGSPTGQPASFLDPLGLGGIFTAISGQKVPGISSAMDRLGQWAVDAMLLIGGLIMVVVAFVIIAKSGGSDSSQPAPAAAPPAGEDQAEDEPGHGKVAGAAEDGAEDAAVVA